MTFPLQYISAFVLSALIASATAGVVVLLQEGVAFSLSDILFFGLIAFLPVLIGGLIVGLPAHAFLLRLRLLNPIWAASIGTGLGVLAAISFVSVISHDATLDGWAAKTGGAAGLVAGFTWWATILRFLKEDTDG